MIQVSEKWKMRFPGAHIGTLIIKNTGNPSETSALDTLQNKLENDLRSMFSDYSKESLKNLPAIRVYTEYFRRFKKTYHVLLQLESVVLKGKSQSKASALVKAMFMAELKNLVLTAGHDLHAIRRPLKIDVSSGEEEYTLLNGRRQILKPDDMIMRDDLNVISSVIYGPDRRTKIIPETKDVIFVVYAPPGIDERLVYQHLNDIKLYIMCFSSSAEVESLEVAAGK